MIRKLALFAATTLALIAVSSKSPAARQAPASQGSVDPSKSLKSTLDRLLTQMLREQPELATSLGVPDDIAGGKYSDRLSDASAEGLARQLKILSDVRAALAGIDRASLPAADAVSYDVAATYIDNSLKGGNFGFGTYGFSPATPYVVTQLAGAYVSVPDFLDTQHRVTTVTDAEDYLARVRAFATVLDQETARVKADADKGIIPPDFAIDGAVKQLEDFAGKAPADTVLVQALKRKVADAKLEAAQQKELVARAERLVREDALPAYKRQAAQLQALRSRAPHHAGVWNLPSAPDYYAIALQNFNTTTLTPDEIHDMGLKLIEQLHQDMDAILKAQGLATGTVAERVQQLSKDPRQLYPNTDEGREQLLKDLNQQLADLQPLLPKYFGVMPRARLELRRVPPYIEAGAPGGYYQSPSLDGSRPGFYYINLRDTSEWPKFTLPTLTYHEGNPGHHWQGTIAQETPGLHMIRGAVLGFSGYAEGWALYAEQLADEMGVYEKNPYGRVGYLQSMAFRAARLVVDTGLHHKKWSREKAIDYMVGVTGDQRSSITTEVERYAVLPGQATAYMVGRQTMNRLRSKAQSQLGPQFDLRGFHDTVLTNAAVPLSVLDTVVNTWVAVNKSAK